MGENRQHPHLPKLWSQVESGRVDRREFLRTATLLGMSATAAYGAIGFADPVPARAQGALPKGGRLRIGMRIQEIKDWQTISWIEMSNIGRSVFDYLCNTGPDNITRPELAQRWEASPDLKTWTFHLRRDVKWRKGQSFVADHAIWTIQRALNPATGSSIMGLLSYLTERFDTGQKDDKGQPRMSTRLWDSKAIEKVDDYTIRLNLKSPQLGVPEHLFHYPFFMMHPDDDGKFSNNINGTGPYELTQHEVGRRAVLRARPDYWGGAPNIEALEFVDLGSDPSAGIAALASQQIDGLYQLDYSMVDAVKALPNVELYSINTAYTAIARTKCNVKPFDDARVRKAMRLAVDSQKVLDIVFRGAGAAAEHHHVARVHPEYAQLPPMKQDIAAAKRLLAEAGHPNGIDIEIAANDAIAWEPAAVQVMAEMWKEAGIRAKINVMPSTNYWANWTKVPFGFTTWAHRPLGVMTLSLAYRTGQAWNESDYSNPEFDRLLTEAEGILDVDKRRVVMAKLQSILQEDGPIIQPIWRVIQTAYSKRVKNFKIHPSLYLSTKDVAISAT